jgi:hypothetical protein
MKHIFSEKEHQYLRDNYLAKSSNDLGILLNCTGQVVRRWLRGSGLIVPKEVSNHFRTLKKIGKTTFTQAEDDYIKQHYLTHSFGQLGKDLGRSDCGISGAIKRLGLVIPADIMAKRLVETRIKPGTPPPNKGLKQAEYMTQEAIDRTKSTRFQKGNKPHNTKEHDGVISIRHKKGDPPYKYIRISIGNWQLLQRYNWEQVHGPIPDGYCLWCLGDTLDCDPDNWELITRLENRIRNSGTRDLSDKRVANYLSTSSRSINHDLRDEILNHPELIKAKRTQLLINRKIKEHGTKQNSRPE